MSKPPGNEPYFWDKAVIKLTHEWLNDTINHLGTCDPEILLEYVEFTMNDCLTAWLESNDHDTMQLANVAVCAKGMIRFHLAIHGARWRVEELVPDFLDVLNVYIGDLLDEGRESQDWELMAKRLAIKVNALCQQGPW